MLNSARLEKNERKGHASTAGNVFDCYLCIQQNGPRNVNVHPLPLDPHKTSFCSTEECSKPRSTRPKHSPPSRAFPNHGRPYRRFCGTKISPSHTLPYLSFTPPSANRGPPLFLPPISEVIGTLQTAELNDLYQPRSRPAVYPQLPPASQAGHFRRLPLYSRSQSIPAELVYPSLDATSVQRPDGSNYELGYRIVELELVNDLLCRRVSELESSQRETEIEIEALTEVISQCESKEIGLSAMVSQLQDERRLRRQFQGS